MHDSDRWLRQVVLGVAVGGIWATFASAQTPTLESRLREALQRTTQDLHALQDQNEALRADVAKAHADAAALTQTNSELKARLDEAIAKTPPPATAPPANDTALTELRAQLNAANTRIATLQSQAAAGDAAAQAKVNEAQSRAAAAAKNLAATQNLVKVCHDTNQKLVGVADEILNTYKSESFRSVWLRSYEPVLGLDRVKLQNIMQDFEDKLLDHRLAPSAP